MTKYELLKTNENILLQFIKSGIISCTTLRDLEIFENFININFTTKIEKYKWLSQNFQLSEIRIEQIITNMYKKV